MNYNQIHKIAMLSQVAAMLQDKKPQDRPFLRKLIDSPDNMVLTAQENEKLCKMYLDNIKLIRRLEFWQL